MLSTERISALIAALYDCVLAPDKWDESLDAIRLELNLASAFLGTNALPSGEPSIAVYVGITPEWRARMFGYGAEVVRIWGGLEKINAYPLDEPILLSQATDPAEWKGNRWATEWAEPQGLIDAVTIPIARDPTLIGNLTCGRHRSAGEVSEAEMSALRVIAPHVRRAVVIGKLLDQQMIAASTFASALETVTSGVVLVDEDLEIVHANAAAGAMLATGDPIRSHRGALQLPSAMATNALKSAVTLASASEVGLGPRGLGIPLRRGDGAAAVAHVLPLHRQEIRQGVVQRACAAVFVAPAASPPRLPADALALLYDLTPAEVRVFEMIAAGRTQQEIARTLSIAPSTVKTHLLRVFEKTGCNRQAGLVRLAASVSSPA